MTISHRDEKYSMRILTSLMVALALLGARPAFGDDRDSDPVTSASPTIDAVKDGAFLPLTMSARTGSAKAVAWGFAGYDSSQKGLLTNIGGEVSLWGPVALRGGTVYSNSRARLRPYVGLRVQLLSESEHGVNGSLGAFFKTEGFTEPEGEIEVVAAVSRRVGNLVLTGNLAYGQDPEGNERDGEIRASAFRHIGRLAVGFDSRARSAIGAQGGVAAMSEPRFDAMAGPLAMVVVGPIMLFGEVGPSAFKLPGVPTQLGVAAFGGMGSAF